MEDYGFLVILIFGLIATMVKRLNQTKGGAAQRPAARPPMPASAPQWHAENDAQEAAEQTETVKAQAQSDASQKRKAADQAEIRAGTEWKKRVEDARTETAARTQAGNAVQNAPNMQVGAAYRDETPALHVSLDPENLQRAVVMHEILTRPRSAQGRPLYKGMRT